ncbi:MAG: 4-alpha-glucanotransferase [Bryobacterales bacterium]|nr:4-alpha-glucanotransferase [Bryobacterales bacterium]
MVSFRAAGSYAEALTRAAEAWGIEREYWDIWGCRHQTGPEVECAILHSLGVDASSEESLNAALEERLWREWSQISPPVLILAAEPAPTLPISVPEALAGECLRLTLHYEDQPPEQRTIDLAELPDHGTATVRDTRFVRKQIPLGVLPLGYHHAAIALGDRESNTRLIIAPNRAWLPDGIGRDRRLAGVAVSLWGVRSKRNWGCGDFSDLFPLIDWVGDAVGGSFLGLNPLHSIANRQPYNTSPYLPNCAYYRNYLYLDVERIEDLQSSPIARRLLATDRIRKELEALRNSEFVEYERVARWKLLFLRLAFRQFQTELAAATARARQFQAWAEAEGGLLDRFAVHATLDEAIHRRNPDIWNWPGWPRDYRDPASAATVEFARERRRGVLFHKYVQWQIDVQLRAAAEYAAAKKLPLGLYHDLALATDRFGADLWSHPDAFVSGCRVGSPPDDFSPNGQDWGFPPPNTAWHEADGYRLFADSIRKNARHGGALRIDHVMRFFRLFWIPDGLTAAAGTYVRDHWQNLLHILALESVRGRFVVIGEDLGTVEPWVREELARFGILSYRLLYFEKHSDGSFQLPSEYPGQALVSGTTHDLPTLAGFWLGRDIEARFGAGLIPEAAYHDQLASRSVEKQRLLDVLLSLNLLPDGFPRNAGEIPEYTGELHNAVVGFLANTRSTLLILNQEDLTKETEQQNLPGSTSEYPNWRRKMRYTVEELQTLPAALDFNRMARNWIQQSGRAR